jgi:hypothetical protein
MALLAQDKVALGALIAMRASKRSQEAEARQTEARRRGGNAGHRRGSGLVGFVARAS